ncbi:MAG: hypothetical protein RIS64_380 [Bacteroidota bacterium]|jgi:hypothetical protein
MLKNLKKESSLRCQKRFVQKQQGRHTEVSPVATKMYEKKLNIIFKIA